MMEVSPGDIVYLANVLIWTLAVGAYLTDVGLAIYIGNGLARARLVSVAMVPAYVVYGNIAAFAGGVELGVRHVVGLAVGMIFLGIRLASIASFPQNPCRPDYRR